MIRKRTILSLALLATTAACGGGGGGAAGPAPAAASGGAAPASGVSTNFNNPSVVASTDAKGNVGTPTMAADQTSQTATMTVGDTGETITINVPGMGVNHTFNTSANQLALDGTVKFNGADVFSGGGAQVAMYKDGNGGVLVSDNSGKLSFSNYGIWANGDSDLGQKVTAVGAFATGAETLATDLPTTGTATYQGSAVATGTSGGQNTNWAGTFTGGVDFAARTATVGVNMVSSTDQSALNLSSGPMSMTGPRFSGAIAGSGVSGSTAGALYGPAANEMAGVFSASGAGTTVLGAYGGAQTPH